MPTELLLTIVAVFALVALATGSLATWLLAQAQPERRRLKRLATPAAPSLINEPTLTDQPNSRTERLGKILATSPERSSELQERLASAGYHHVTAAINYRLVEVVVPLVLVVMMVATRGLAEGLVLGMVVGPIGYLLPRFVLGRHTAKRREAIQNGLPDVLDLLVVCVEAGSGLDQAIMKASEELGLTHKVLAEELRMVTTEVRAGVSRVEALRNFAKRTQVDEVRSLVAILTQTDRFGTSVGQALRTQADSARIKRRQRAEERAAKVGVKLVFPLVLCLFPALYVVCFGPVIVKIMRVFFQNGGL